jgi:hypothetical protein
MYAKTMSILDRTAMIFAVILAAAPILAIATQATFL